MNRKDREPLMYRGAVFPEFISKSVSAYRSEQANLAWEYKMKQVKG